MGRGKPAIANFIGRRQGLLFSRPDHTGAKDEPMAFETLLAEINLLLTEMETQPEDAHELQLTLHEKLSELRATGMPVPDDLAELEKRLEAELSAAKD